MNETRDPTNVGSRSILLQENDIYRIQSLYFSMHLYQYIA